MRQNKKLKIIVLPKKNRLKKNKDFDRVFKKGKKFYGKNLSLILLKSDLKNTRVGLIVSKKVSKKACLRNKIKRRIYSLIRDKLPKIKNQFDIVIITKPEIKEKKFFEIAEIIDEIFKKAKIC